MSEEQLNALGSGDSGFTSRGTPYKEVQAELLEWFAWDYAMPGTDMTVEISTDEFTCLCPKTGQPDYATIKVEYVPRARCVESKSFKLYLASFRNVGMFHEAFAQCLGAALVALLEPAHVTVRCEFKPRGGINFHPQWAYWRPLTGEDLVG